VVKWPEKAEIFCVTFDKIGFKPNPNIICATRPHPNSNVICATRMLFALPSPKAGLGQCLRASPGPEQTSIGREAWKAYEDNVLCLDSTS
jgi:hypothetical protein